MLSFYLSLSFFSIWLILPGQCGGTNQKVQITVPGVTTEEEEYVCYYWKPTIDKLQYITSFSIHPDSSKIHHFIVFICQEDFKANRLEHSCHEGCMKIIYAWALNAPKLQLPTDVGFKLDGSKEHLMLQLHYNGAVEAPDYTSLHLTITTDPQPYSAYVGLMFLNSMEFPPNTEKILVNGSCQYKNNVDLHVIAFRTHSHTHGRVITGYVRRKNEWLLIGKGNPLWPQAFWPVETPNLEVKKDDIVVVRGVYSTKGEYKKVVIGDTHNDEMFNYYMMYYINSSYPESFFICDSDSLPEISSQLPSTANDLLPPNKTLDAMASMHHQHTSLHQDHFSSSKHFSLHQILPLDNWPNQLYSAQLTNSSTISKDNQGNLFVFRRGFHEWKEDTFDLSGNYLKSKDHPIEEHTILKISSKEGSIIKRGGNNFFFMPHGIFIDSHNFIWTTDVALHQVFKFSQSILDGGKMEPLLTLGRRFKPGEDSSHFCQPADIVVTSEGDIYVADGYCNQRVMVFDKNGVFKMQISIELQPKITPPFHLPHSISLNEKNKIIYVADRPQKTIFMFNLDGTFLKGITLKESNYPLFSVDYNPSIDRLFCINGNIMGLQTSQNSKVFVLNTQDHSIVSSWDIPHSNSPDSMPHSVAVNNKGDEVFVVSIGKKGNFLKFKGTLKNNNLGLGYGSYERHPFRTDLGLHFSPNFMLTVAVFVCLFFIPLIIVICTIFYVKNRLRKKAKFYTPLKVDKTKDLEVGSKDAYLFKRLNELSDDDEDAFDSNLHLKPNGKA